MIESSNLGMPTVKRLPTSNSRIPVACIVATSLGLLLAALPARLSAEAVSEPAILQMFEAKWDTIENRMPDVFGVGYGAMWTPPPNRAGSAYSVGYDVFDRFDLGSPRDETHYGTESSFRQMVAQANRSTVDVYSDFIINHNGFGNRLDSTFVAQGGYPGFALTLPGVDVNGDFHDPYLDWSEDPVNGQLFGLNDIAQEKNYPFIRQPTEAGNPSNIPAGTLYNKPDPNNARYYPDQGLGGTTVYDPELGQTVTLYDYNSSDPMAGDPVLENAMGLLMRNARWMVEDLGVKGFRIDAARHSPEFALDYLDQAVFRAVQSLQHDGSAKPVYMFSEVASSDQGYVQSFVRRDLPNQYAISTANTTVGGNRDALDFPLFWAMKDNLTSNGLANNWHDIRGASLDSADRPSGSEVWHTDGSQGVAFVSSHDDTGPYLANVAYAYTLLRPGNAIVYLNAEQYGSTGSFPQPGKVDALGGYYGDTITKLVEIRNSHGRGDFAERWIDDAFSSNGFSNVYIYERQNSMVVGLNSRNDGVVETRSGVQTSFTPGTVLVELTGNAADSSLDPGGVIPEAVRVDANGRINVSIPGNNPAGRGYVVYGVASPVGSLLLTGVSDTLSGPTLTPSNFGTARLSDIDVITGDSFAVHLATTPVTLPTPAGESVPVRDYDADGDRALLRFDDGLDLNGNGVVDESTPGGVSYGFEEFVDVNTPGYVYSGGTNIGTGTGTFEQTIDATQLSEGRHYITVRAFRHRDAAAGGDGGPAVYTDFRRTIYVDRLPPEAEIVSFSPFASDPGNPNDRDLVVGSVDETADSMHVFLDLPATVTDSEVLQMIGSGSSTDYYDRDQWVRGYFDVQSGNHVVTVVTFEPTGNYNVQRFTGVATQTNIGLGFGDVSGDGYIRANDINGAGSFREVLLSQNTEFNPAADSNGDGLVDDRDLFALEGAITATTTDPRVYTAYEALLAARGDLDGNAVTDENDLATLYSHMGGSDWLFDLNVDGTVDLADAEVFVTQLLRTSPGDYNLDGVVDAADYTVWRDSLGSSYAADGNFDGEVDAADFVVWNAQFGSARVPFAPPSTASATMAVPEPGTLLQVIALIACLFAARRM